MSNPRKNYCLDVWSEFACFTRPECKVERVSYDVITPSAARAIFSAIFWKPAIRWHITAIEVLNPIKFVSIRRNEVAAIASERSKCVYVEEARQQKAGILLRDPHYRLFADLEYLPPDQREKDIKPEGNGPETPMKYFAMFERRAGRGQSIFAPYFGCREFTANFRLLAGEELEKARKEHPALGPESDCDLSLMLFDLDYRQNPPLAMFYRPVMKNGTIVVPEEDSLEVLR